MTTERHITSLDGLRGIAILFVIAYHAFGMHLLTTSLLGRALYQASRSGFAGVDLFFVLSGFLITRILLASKTAENYYKVFYFRRLLRIFPLYYLALIVVFFILPAVAVHHGDLGLRTHPVAFTEQLWYWFNVSNIWTAFYPYRVPLLGHFWSLAVEEQFYFLWPTLIRRVELSRLKTICLVGLFVPCILRTAIPDFGPNLHYRFTPFHMEGLFAGALLATLEASGELQAWQKWFPRFALFGMGAFYFSLQHPFHVDLAFTFLAIGLGGLVGLCLFPNKVSRIVSNQVLLSFGRYSYCIYIVHIAVLAYFAEKADNLLHGHPLIRGISGCILAVATSFFVASLSYKYFEKPLLSLKRLMPYREAREAAIV